MTEAAKVFHDDIREKKSIKNSANKTNRAGKGPIRFPSDYLSKKDKEALNGECSTWKYSDFPTREEFNRMPDDIKIGYLNWIINIYGVNVCSISKYVFNQVPSALVAWLKGHSEINMYINHPKKGVCAKKKDIARLISDVERARTMTSVEAEPSPEPEPAKAQDDFTVAQPFRMSSMDFSMDGFDMDFLNLIRDRFEDQKIRVNVSVYVEKSLYDDNTDGARYE